MTTATILMPPKRSRLKKIWRWMLSDPRAVLSISYLVILTAVAALAPWIAPADGELWRYASYRFHALVAREWAQFREARELWQLTPVGREEHRIALAEDVGGTHVASLLHDHYHTFLQLNDRFKSLCGDWQLRDGAPNDHSDAKYDAAVVKRLVALDGEGEEARREDDERDEEGDGEGLDHRRFTCCDRLAGGRGRGRRAVPEGWSLTGQDARMRRGRLGTGSVAEELADRPGLPTGRGRQGLPGPARSDGRRPRDVLGRSTLG